MSLVIHRAEDRGKADHGWLQSRFSFSFASWHDPERMGFGALRVLNDDIIAPNSGFGMHPHKNMEIITIVTEGEVTHEDSLGNKSVLDSSKVQAMSAGKGVVHSEFNLGEKPLALFQMWITPKSLDIVSRYGEKVFPESGRKNKFQLLASPDGREGSLPIHQDAYVSRIELDKGKKISYESRGKTNALYIFIIHGDIHVDGHDLKQRDALGVGAVASTSMEATSKSDALLIEVPYQ